MNWPDNKSFAFTIIDDTDNARLENIKPVYDFLYEKNILTTKTVWVYPPRDRFTGDCLMDENYYNFVIDLKRKGFEIALHGVGSGDFKRKEILDGLEIFKSKTGKYPDIHINHSKNPDNIYWGNQSFHSLLKLYSKLRNSKENFYGADEKSEYFWGDFVKENISYIRLWACNGINTLKFDPKMPFRDKNKKYANFLFSSSDGSDVEKFNKLLEKKNIDRLKKEKGLCIVYVHFASGFVKEGVLNKEFQEKISYLAQQNGWFVPALEILNHIKSQKKNEYVSDLYLMKQEAKIISRRFKSRINSLFR